MALSNKKLGNSFEEELCELLAQNGFWAHNMAQNEVGQPADIIAVKNNFAVLIDCKVCSKDRFNISRVEPNQEAAMTMWKAKGNQLCYFALKLSDGEIYMVHFDNLKENLNKNQITLTFEDWLGDVECLLR